MSGTEVASFAGVRLPDVESLRGKSLDKRIRILTKYARKVDCKSKDGLSVDEALVFVQHWRPAFGSLKLLRSQPLPDGRRDLKLAVDNYTCPSCRLRFDEKDIKSTSPEGMLCPKCSAVVAKPVAP